ncbi:multiple epidermal growth factor-like domains protein 10 [Anneissia japonica]|uniref:multiple epidermal growth factor-like domains protein 10 n=1 Tax=Anneissia japonica TaxID=1529436 RepID=UPI00142570AE|nr:multiple epidermal growth factor-like domains protein 10 [Anneissia japonica]
MRYVGPFVFQVLLYTLISCSGKVNAQVSVTILYEHLETITNDTVREVCRYDVISLFGWSLYNACETECSRRKFDCDLKCPCRNGAKCNPTLSLCQCAPGWWGDFCQYPCEDGFHGNGCNVRCQCNKDEICDHATGRCNAKNSLNCRTTPYHSSCRGRCDCPRDTVCSVVTGSCTCPERCKTGQSSADYCPECHTLGKICFDSGKWNGDICNRCNDAQNLTCIPTCEEGWQGFFCRVCQKGRYGPNCRKICTCGEGAVCEQTTGQCLCGKRCYQRCRSGFYGPKCHQRCDCPSGVLCTDDTGVCTCPDGKYGIMCSINCSCPSGGKCDVITGTCLNCHDCGNEEGSSKIVTAGGVFVGIAIATFIACIVIIIVRYKRIKIFHVRKFEVDAVIRNSRLYSSPGETCSLSPDYKTHNRNSHYERSIQSCTLPPLPSPLLHNSSSFNTAQGRTPNFATSPPNQPEARLYEDPESIISEGYKRKSEHGEEIDVNSIPEGDQVITGNKSIDTKEKPQYFQLEKAD